MSDGTYDLDLISIDLDLVGQQRRLLAAQQVADGGMMEKLDDLQMANEFPTTPGTTSPLNIPDQANSLFVKNTGTPLQETYSGNVRWVRFAPKSENSQGRLWAVTYEMVVQSDINQGQASSQTTTEVTTRMIVPDGQTIFVGGLIKHSIEESKSGVPVVGRIPGIGRLFSNRENTITNTETVVLITPTILTSNTKTIDDRTLEAIDRMEDHRQSDMQALDDEMASLFMKAFAEIS